MFQKARFLLAFSQLLTLFICSIFAQSRENDSLALVAFQNANPTGNLSWSADTPLDSWEGVTLNNEGRVSELSLEFMSLTSVPAEIGQLDQLTKLKLRYNKIISIAAEIGNLTALEYLNLSANKIEVLPDDIGQLTNLIELNLNNNLFQEIPSAVGKLTNLENFYVSGNSNLQSLPENIGDLSALKKIIVTKTAVQSLPESFGLLANLEYINFEENALANIPETIESVVPKSFDGKFAYVNFGYNFLERASLSTKAIEWLDRFAGDWEGTQQAVSIKDIAHSHSNESHITFSIRNNVLTFTSLPIGENKYTILSIDGRVLHNDVIPNRAVELPVSRGFYLMKVESQIGEEVFPLSL